MTANQLADILKYIYCTPFGGKKLGGMFIIHRDYFEDFAYEMLGAPPAEHCVDEDGYAFPPTEQFMCDLKECLRKQDLGIAKCVEHYFVFRIDDINVREVPRNILNRFFLELGCLGSYVVHGTI
jgi:hypothetical protein